jgi:lipoprotein-releasing system permease protein
VSFPFYIAFRYLFSKKSHHAINIISGVSVFGIAIATAALVCILSVFNGFQDMVAGLFTAFDPQLKILPAEGKFMAADEPELERVRGDERIAVWSEVVEDNALFTLANRQVMGVVKGVDDEFEQLIDMDRIGFGEGVFQLHADVIDYGVAGIGLLSQLGTTVDFPPIQIYAPRKGERIDLNNPAASFSHEEVFSPQLAFNVKQGKYDAQYVITNIALARRLFERQGEVTQIELKLTDGADTDRVKSDLQRALGEKYRVLDRYEQQEDTFRIMKVEKLISYIFLTFILLIACFNIIGSLSMLIIDKRDDAVTLRNLGATNRQIAGIFMLEGRMITLVGAIVGLLLGVGLCLLQQEFGLLKFGRSAGNYIIDVYPVSVHVQDLVLIFATVIIVGFVSVWYPVRHLSKKSLELKNNN